MENLAKGATRERVDFSRIKTSIPIPNLIEVQKKSYERFLQMDLHSHRLDLLDKEARAGVVDLPRHEAGGEFDDVRLEAEVVRRLSRFEA